ncbi:MAG: glycosyltransferase family 4 protein [Burkholderiaceae bacterium]
MTAAPRLLFVVNNPDFFLSHRAGLARAAQRAGYDVHLATMPGERVATIQAMGITHHALRMTRSGTHPLQELRTLIELYRLFRRVRPDVVHLVTIKPVLYGGIAARLARVPGLVAAISGLGFVFMREGARGTIVRRVVATLYRWALGHRHSRVVFQNAADRDTLAALGAVRADQVVMIRGAGVDLALFDGSPEPSSPPVVVTMAARLLRDKGVVEFVQAARLLRERGVAVRMQLAGAPDEGNPASLQADDVRAWQQEGVVACLGERGDIAEIYAQSHIVALPSYREGLPKSLLEAAAAGRVVVTTDVPGCRDAIDPDETGVLVPVRDAVALADAIERLAHDAGKRRQMGAAGRALALRAFDVADVERTHVAIYDALRGAGPNKASTQ